VIVGDNLAGLWLVRSDLEYQRHRRTSVAVG
jgi:hypothetical protein